MKTLDVRGLSCPEPVLKVKSALNTEKELNVLADEVHTVRNIIRFAETEGKTVSVQKAGSEFEILIR